MFWLTQCLSWILVVGHRFHVQNRFSESQTDSIIKVTSVLVVNLNVHNNTEMCWLTCCAFFIAVCFNTETLAREIQCLGFGEWNDMEENVILKKISLCDKNSGLSPVQPKNISPMNSILSEQVPRNRQAIHQPDLDFHHCYQWSSPLVSQRRCQRFSSGRSTTTEYAYYWYSFSHSIVSTLVCNFENGCHI